MHDIEIERYQSKHKSSLECAAIVTLFVLQSSTQRWNDIFSPLQTPHRELVFTLAGNCFRFSLLILKSHQFMNLLWLLHSYQLFPASGSCYEIDLLELFVAQLLRFKQRCNDEKSVLSCSMSSTVFGFLYYSSCMQALANLFNWCFDHKKRFESMLLIEMLV